MHFALWEEKSIYYRPSFRKPSAYFHLLQWGSFARVPTARVRREGRKRWVTRIAGSCQLNSQSVAGANVIYIHECQINPSHCPTKFARTHNGGRQPLYTPSLPLVPVLTHNPISCLLSSPSRFIPQLFVSRLLVLSHLRLAAVIRQPEKLGRFICSV